MRPNQQNSNNNNNNNNNKNRQRGRNNNGGRKHVNPLSRNFESNGPDVKVRGNASHVAEKYLQLARDAQSSGDSVMAENYLQHAEHYFRIVSAAQPQGGPRTDQFGQDADEDDDFPPINDRFSSPEPRNTSFSGSDQQQAPAQQQPSQQQPSQQQPSQQQPSQQQPSQQQPAEAGGTQSAAAEGEGNGQVEGEGEPRRQRERRPRRRSRGGEGAPAGSDPGAAPQPDVGDLPAFLTAGTTPTAAE